MWTDDKSTSNPALNTGLKELRQGVILPKGLIAVGPKAYANEWTLKVLPTTVNDGLVEVSTVLGNPYFVDLNIVGDATVAETMFASDPSYLGISTGTDFEFTQLIFLKTFQYTVKSGETLPLTFKMQLRKNNLNANIIVDRMEKLIKLGASGSFKNMYLNWTPKATLATMSGFLYPDFATYNVYPDTQYVTLKVGSDFPMIKEWFYREFNITTTPTSLLPPPQSTVTLPTLTTPPVVPTDTPTPTLPTTIEPTVEPTVGPTNEPTVAPTVEPTAEPTVTPTASPAA
ncbi:hypothetical protein BGZ96_006518 [Linnemannia gamsii]|uniref:Uncharacterized protein n=1 Tax=Linnemannia gamsii TaxID=64522 RepID=A0ABQ7K368_9FUNG|nr:hypothetical protein BGZ96_006518 [Linnemannia gamsii]